MLRGGKDRHMQVCIFKKHMYLKLKFKECSKEDH